MVSNQDELWYNLLFYSRSFKQLEAIVSNQDELWYNLLCILAKDNKSILTVSNQDELWYNLLFNGDEAVSKNQLCFKPRWALI